LKSANLILANVVSAVKPKIVRYLYLAFVVIPIRNRNVCTVYHNHHGDHTVTCTGKCHSL